MTARSTTQPARRTQITFLAPKQSLCAAHHDARPPGTRLRPFLVFLVAVFSVLVTTGCGAGAAYSTSTTTPASPYIYTAIWRGQSVRLTLVPSTNVGQLPDAVAAGQVTSFQTDDPSYTCLEGAVLNVWSAPQEYPGNYLVQGTCPNGVKGVWSFPLPSTPTP